MRWVIAVFAMIPSAPAFADGMSDMVAKLPPPAFTSQKSSLALEYCIGLGISDWLTVSTLHGENRTLVAGVAGGATLGLLVSIGDLGSKRTVSFHATKGWDERTGAVIRSCV